MELTLRKNNNKIFLIPLLIACLIMVVPSAIVFANAMTDPYVGMSGVNNSDLTAGMTGVNRSDLLIDWDNPGHINPSSPSYGTMMAIPLIFFLLAILLILGMVFSKELNLKMLIIVAVLISLALALLSGVNFSTNSLLGV